MKILNQKLVDLFQTSDELLLPDKSTLHEISLKQQEVETFGEELVLHGFTVMRDYLQELASQNKASLYKMIDDFNWTPDERSESN